MKFRLTLFLVIFWQSVFAQEILKKAHEFFKAGNFEEAAKVYKQAAETENINLFYSNYFKTLLTLKNYSEAKTLVNKQLTKYPKIVSLKADLAYIYEQEFSSEKEFENLVDEAIASSNKPIELMNYFYKLSKYDLAIKLITGYREKNGNSFEFYIHLARLYMYKNKKPEMLEELINFSILTGTLDYAKQLIQDTYITEEEQKSLEQSLYQYVRKNPNEIILSDLLTWHFVNLKKYSRAFMQAKSLDKRLGLIGVKVLNLAHLAYNNQEYEMAAEMFQHLIDEYADPKLSNYAQRYLVQAKEESIKTMQPIDLEKIKGLIADYEEIIKNQAGTNNEVESLKNSALLIAFYLKDFDKSVDYLSRAISTSSGDFKDKCKISLADIYILKNEPWEASLLYMQVEKDQKDTDLGEQAKLKNAKLYYFIGQFDLAKSILDVLKKATSREIANDAMELSLLIQDNSGFDSTDVALTDYSKVELLIFQNQKQAALDTLDQLYETYKSHSLADDILALKAELQQELKMPLQAAETLKLLLATFQYEVTADEALYALAGIYKDDLELPAEAMKAYERLLKEYPGSVFTNDARKQYRTLRGDTIN